MTDMRKKKSNDQYFQQPDSKHWSIFRTCWPCLSKSRCSCSVLALRRHGALLSFRIRSHDSKKLVPKPVHSIYETRDGDQGKKDQRGREMVVMAVDGGSKRRLPSWMLGITSTNQEKKSDNECEKTDGKDGGAVSSSVFVESEKKSKGKRKPRRQDLKTEDSIPEVVEEKKRSSSIRRVASQKKLKLKKAGARSTIKTEIPSTSDKDGELTVEDLVKIAKEYVKADADTAEHRSLDRDCEIIKQPQKTSTFKSDYESSFCVPNSNAEPAAYQETASCDSTTLLTNEQNLTSTSRTGDPAQDMLNLFLGPLLNKLPGEEKTSEFSTNSSKFAYEFRNSSQKGVEPTMSYPVKRKSSLRDKVAGLLD